MVEGSAAPALAGACVFRESEALLDVVAVGGVNTGRDAYIAHLTGAKAVQIGSALIKEGAGALGRIDRELDALLAENGHASVSEIMGKAAASADERSRWLDASGRHDLLRCLRLDSSPRRAHGARS